MRKVGASGNGNDDSKLIGIALDGYLIYDKRRDNDSTATGDDVVLTASTRTSNGQSTGLTGDTLNTLDQLHGHTRKTQHMSTATIDTLLGSYFRGLAAP